MQTWHPKCLVEQIPQSAIEKTQSSFDTFNLANKFIIRWGGTCCTICYSLHSNTQSFFGNDNVECVSNHMRLERELSAANILPKSDSD